MTDRATIHGGQPLADASQLWRVQGKGETQNYANIFYAMKECRVRNEEVSVEDWVRGHIREAV